MRFPSRKGQFKHLNQPSVFIHSAILDQRLLGGPSAGQSPARSEAAKAKATTSAIRPRGHEIWIVERTIAD